MFWGEVKLALLFEARAGIALVQGLEGDPVLVTIVLSVFVEADEGEGRPERSSVPAQGTGAAPRCQVKLALLFEARAGIALAQGLEGQPYYISSMVLNFGVEELSGR